MASTFWPETFCSGTFSAVITFSFIRATSFELGESAGAALPAAVHAFLLPCTRPARPVTATSMPGALAACLSRATDVSQLTHFPRRLLAMPLMRGRGEKRSEFSFFLHNILAEVVMTNLY